MVLEVPYNSPPPNIYYLRSLIGYKWHDYTKKKAPAWPFVRYIPPPKPPVHVSTPPFMKKLKKKKIKQAKKKSERIKKSGRPYSRTFSKHKTHGTTPLGPGEKSQHTLGTFGEEASCDFNMTGNRPSQIGFQYTLRRKVSVTDRYILEPTEKCPTCYRMDPPKDKQQELDRSVLTNRIIEQWAQSPCGPEKGHGFISFPLNEQGRQRGMKIQRRHKKRVAAIEALLDEFDKGQKVTPSAPDVWEDEHVRRAMVYKFRKRLDELECSE